MFTACSPAGPGHDLLLAERTVAWKLLNACEMMNPEEKKKEC